jgi:hypothetical protein
MSFLLSVIFATRCRSTHHRLALDALRFLKGPDAAAWRGLLLHHHEQYLKGSKAPDDIFRDYKNHVLHVREGDWGGAIEAAQEWRKRTVRAMKDKDWSHVAWCAGVMSHYIVDPCQPFHTHQTEEENVIHRAVEYSFYKSYGALQTLLEREPGGYPNIALSDGNDWVADIVRQGARAANQHYETIVDHYNFAAAAKRAEDGLDYELRAAIAQLIGRAVISWARVLDRMCVEANVKPPRLNGGMQGLFLALEAPIQGVLGIAADARERVQVAAQYEEYRRTGKVRSTLSEDDSTVRALHAAEVLKVPLSSLDARWPREIGTAYKPGRPPKKRTTKAAKPEAKQAKTHEAALPAPTTAPAHAAASATAAPPQPKAAPPKAPQPPAKSAPAQEPVRQAATSPPKPAHAPTPASPPPPPQPRAPAERAQAQSAPQRSAFFNPAAPVAPSPQRPQAAPATAAQQPPPQPQLSSQAKAPAAAPSAKRQAASKVPSQKQQQAATAGNANEGARSAPQAPQSVQSPLAKAIDAANASHSESRASAEQRPPPLLLTKKVVDKKKRKKGGDEEVCLLKGTSRIADAPSIGPKMARRFQSVGIRTVSDLLALSPATVAVLLDIRNISALDISDWQAQAMLSCTVPDLIHREAQAVVACGPRSVEELAQADAGALAEAMIQWAKDPEGAHVWGSGSPSRSDAESLVERARSVVSRRPKSAA